MIQRIQSLWLVLAACCMALCFLTPVAEYRATMQATGQQVEARLDLIGKDNPEMMNQMVGLEPVVNYSQKMSGFATWPLIVVAALCAAIAIVSIFLYKNRVRQLRVVALGFLLNVVYVFLVFFWAVNGYADVVSQAMGATEMQVRWFAGAYAPIVALVMFLLARSGIRKDEAKVRAADRLR